MGTVVLAGFRRVDAVQADFGLGAALEHGQRVAIGNADHARGEIRRVGTGGGENQEQEEWC